MWMDWNDPDELRRLHDLLGTDPAAVTTIQGPDGPVTDTVEMLVGRLGMPEVGGSYFTFSNENNDLIWGFLAECHRRGWLYKGHDTMPWCPRCGTGLSQMEMNEGYQDREDPGPDRPLPAARPARASRSSSGRRRPGRSPRTWRRRSGRTCATSGSARATDVFWLGKGTLKTALQGPFTVEEEVAGADARRLALPRSVR